MAKILIIDRFNRATDHLRTLLKEEGHEVKTAASRTIALQQVMVRGERFHAVFLDASIGTKLEDQGPAMLSHLRRLAATKQAMFYGAVLRIHAAAKLPGHKYGVWGDNRLLNFAHCEKAYLPDESEPIWDIPSDILNHLLKIDLPSQ